MALLSVVFIEAAIEGSFCHPIFGPKSTQTNGQKPKALRRAQMLNILHSVGVQVQVRAIIYVLKGHQLINRASNKSSHQSGTPNMDPKQQNPSYKDPTIGTAQFL